MFFKGEVYFESKLEWKHDIKNNVNDFILRASRAGVRLEADVKQLNFSWKHTEQWQVIMAVGFEVDDDKYGLTENPEMAKRFIRDLLDIYMTDDKLTPTYLEDAVVETDEGEFITVPDFYFLDCTEFNDSKDDNNSKMVWENFKRSDEFQAFIETISLEKKSHIQWRKDLASFRKGNATAAPVKIKKRNQKHLENEVESKANERRKIFILDDDEDVV